MALTTQQTLEIIKAQLAIESGCSPDDFDKPENLLTLPALCERRRRFSETAFFFKMTTLGGNAVVSADARLHGWLGSFIAGKPGHGLFEHESLREIDARLEAYGERLYKTHHMFLLRHSTETTCFSIDYPVKWFEREQLRPFYEGSPFPNALGPSFEFSRPDMLAAAAYDGEKLIGMAACSADTPLMWQIGIDVNRAYRGKRIGTYLVSALKDEILRRGKIPYYGASLSNLHSWNIALNCGFRPAWVEVETKQKEEPLK